MRNLKVYSVRSGRDDGWCLSKYQRSLALAAFLVGLLLAFNSSTIKAQDNSEQSSGTGCGDNYDPSVAVDYSKQYQEALKARDYARLKQLKAQKDQANIWAKTSASCEQGGTSQDDSNSSSNSGSSPSSDPDSTSGGNDGSADQSGQADNANSAECERLTIALDNALASQCAYPDNASSCERADYQIVDPSDIGLDSNLFHLDGFHAELLFKDNEYTVAFRGTGGEGALDILDDIQDDIDQSQGFTTSQYVLAQNLALVLRETLGAQNINFTGHSLGGGLATVGALTIGRPAIVYNPAGLHPDVAEDLNLDINDADQLVTNYYVEGEIVTAAQDLDPLYVPNLKWPYIPPFIRLDGPSAPGARRPLAPPSDEWWDENQSSFVPDTIERHYITTVIVSIEEELDANDCEY